MVSSDKSRLWSVGAAICLVLSAQSARAGALTRDNFTFPKDDAVKVVVFRPDVQVGSLRVGGLDDANADWTQTARGNIQKAMEAAGEIHNYHVTFLGDGDSANADLLNEYRSLFETVASEAFQHSIAGNHLPTKLASPATASGSKVYRLDWTLGEQAQRLKAVTGGDYALFFFTHDAYGDAGRKVAQMLMAGLFGAYVPAGVHMGYAGLVDLSSGNVVWLNFNPMMGGDIRTTDGADKRVRELMAGFPTRQTGAAANPAPSVTATK